MAASVSVNSDINPRLRPEFPCSGSRCSAFWRDKASTLDRQAVRRQVSLFWLITPEIYPELARLGGRSDPPPRDRWRRAPADEAVCRDVRRTRRPPRVRGRQSCPRSGCGSETPACGLCGLLDPQAARELVMECVRRPSRLAECEEVMAAVKGQAGSDRPTRWLAPRVTLEGESGHGRQLGGATGCWANSLQGSGRPGRGPAMRSPGDPGRRRDEGYRRRLGVPADGSVGDRGGMPDEGVDATEETAWVMSRTRFAVVAAASRSRRASSNARSEPGLAICRPGPTSPGRIAPGSDG